jgi:hypothetical protein
MPKFKDVSYPRGAGRAEARARKRLVKDLKKEITALKGHIDGNHFELEEDDMQKILEKLYEINGELEDIFEELGVE